MNELNKKEIHVFNYPCNLSTDCQPIIRHFNPGLYHFELYGAAGGSTSNANQIHYGGKGGYTRAAYRFYQKTKVFLFIGGKGSTAKSGIAQGGWNGGGSGISGSAKFEAAGGGGSTDIRIGCSKIDCRYLVAGGGGGAGTPSIPQDNRQCHGGSGGGNVGIDGSHFWNETDENPGKGGTQTTGGKGGVDISEPTIRIAPDGKKFEGGSILSTSFDSSCGGGGSGYFGGGVGAATGGGGGSGFIHRSFFSLDDYPNITLDGNSPFPDINGSLITGNPSNGKIKITVFYSQRVPLTISCQRSIHLTYFIFTLIELS